MALDELLGLVVLLADHQNVPDLNRGDFPISPARPHLKRLTMDQRSIDPKRQRKVLASDGGPHVPGKLRLNQGMEVLDPVDLVRT
ncbi:MAG: hypothetical protein ACLPYW_01900 [Acidimicrobiales bacterium]